MGPTTLSTHFSGMGTVEAGVDYVRQLFPWVGVHTVASGDISAKCRKLLLGGSQSCVFGNLLHESVLTPAMFATVKDLTAKADLMYKTAMHVKNVAWCYQHNCYYKRVGGDVEMGGSPCVDHSRIGKRMGAKGSTFQLLLQWCAWVLYSGSLLAIHENVLGFDDYWLYYMLAEKYVIFKILVHTCHVGFGKMCRRSRWYHVMVRKQGVRIMKDIAETYKAVAKYFEHIEREESYGDCLIKSCHQAETTRGAQVIPHTEAMQTLHSIQKIVEAQIWNTSCQRQEGLLSLE